MKSKRYNTRPKKYIKVLITTCLCFAVPSFAQNVRVAVAANLQSVVRVLQKDFKQKTGIDVEPITGSSGNLAAQIRNGAPYDLFLSADMNFPNLLFKEGFSKKQPVVYARGSLIICSNQDIGFENWERLLMTERVKKIAIANPSIAPYGKAAQEALRHKGIYGDVKPKIVFGESISQVNTYITSGVVEVGFTTQSLVKDAANKTKLYWLAVDPKIYASIEQGMILLKRADGNPVAEKFYQYLLSPAAKAIFKEYGYR